MSMSFLHICFEKCECSCSTRIILDLDLWLRMIGYIPGDCLQKYTSTSFLAYLCCKFWSFETTDLVTHRSDSRKTSSEATVTYTIHRLAPPPTSPISALRVSDHKVAGPWTTLICNRRHHGGGAFPWNGHAIYTEYLCMNCQTQCTAAFAFVFGRGESAAARCLLSLCMWEKGERGVHTLRPRRAPSPPSRISGTRMAGRALRTRRWDAERARVARRARPGAPESRSQDNTVGIIDSRVVEGVRRWSRPTGSEYRKSYLLPHSLPKNRDFHPKIRQI